MIQRYKYPDRPPYHFSTHLRIYLHQHKYKSPDRASYYSASHLRNRLHVEGAADQPYDIPNFRITGHLTDIDVPVGFWRSVGASADGFMFDTFIDELASTDSLPV